MKKIKLLLFPLFFLAINYCNAQTVLLKYDETKEPQYDKGPNQKKFVHGYLKFGMVTPPDKEKTDLKYGGSINIGFGIRKKFKIGSVYSLGWQAELDYTDYKFKKDETIVSPVGSVVETRRFDVTSARLGFFNRFNFDPHRGNFMGTFLDLGIDGAYAFSMTEVYKYSNGYGKAVTKVNNLNYVNSIQSNVFMKLGFSKLSFWATYRITNLFEKDSERSELPRISAGLELGLY